MIVDLSLLLSTINQGSHFTQLTTTPHHEGLLFNYSVYNYPLLNSLQFGKEIQSQQVPGWSQYYLDYKALKKIISAANKSNAETSLLLMDAMHPQPPSAQSFSQTPPIGTGLGVAQVLAQRPSPANADVFSDPPAPWSIPTTGKDEDRGPEFVRGKALFFFKLERELEKVWA